MKEFEKEAQDILGSCTCGPMYLNRGMVAPDCAWHNYAYDVIEAMRQAYNKAIDDAGTEAEIAILYENDPIEKILKLKKP